MWPKQDLEHLTSENITSVLPGNKHNPEKTETTKKTEWASLLTSYEVKSQIFSFLTPKSYPPALLQYSKCLYQKFGTLHCLSTNNIKVV